MAHTPESILEQLQKRNFAPVYFLQGDEPFYIDQISDYIEANALQEHEKGFNQVVVYGKDVDVATVLLQAKRFPMMADRSVVIVKEAQSILDIEKEDGAKQLEAYLKNPLPSTILVFAYKHKTLDGRKALSKAFAQHSVMLTTKKLYDNQVPAWVNNYLKTKNIKATPQAVLHLSEFIGSDLSRLANEIDKLLLNLKPGQTIDEKVVLENVGISKEYNIFELQAAIIAQDVLKANRIINYFEANPKNNPLIPNIGMLFSFFTKLLSLHAAADKSEAGLKKLLGQQAWKLKEFQHAMRVYPIARVVDIIHYIREADLQSKGISGGDMSEADTLRELMFKILHPVPKTLAI
ncbi:DNA polymerase III subunit delta [Pontibacter sp. BT310]|uniref:DNA polymerase III subunit delta n=1 Tax=Pontibacter populi TaxID=890055 RepID=A0ABS6X9W9_9BACT|nr:MULTISPECIES: DNA polymerase III subunit delta [Pontibacter]MBJ6117924.1 DNA polymerase III subunit delta [Pontibacter sp. BT310]MBR0570351.1 DNA polymerase III subunit delta [Microvirga sp. STS03]MBW3364777.1 DNA polymerase III subunit delta [Pontibacter populi]